MLVFYSVSLFCGVLLWVLVRCMVFLCALWFWVHLFFFNDMAIFFIYAPAITDTFTLSLRFALGLWLGLGLGLGLGEGIGIGLGSGHSERFRLRSSAR